MRTTCRDRLDAPPMTRGRTALVAAVALLASLLTVLVPSATVAASGDLDSSWGSSGIVTTVFNSGGDDEAFATAVDAAGRVVVAGKSYDGSTSPHMALARYSRDGTLDTSFSTDGQVVVPSVFGAGNTNGDQANALLIDSSGNILVGGFASDSNGNGALAVARYDTDGNLDTTYGTSGFSTVVVGQNGAYNSVNAMAFQPDGKVILAGTWLEGWVIARLTTGGVLDTTFNPSGPQPGTIRPALGDADADNAYAVTIQPLPGPAFRIVVGGSGAAPPAAAGNFREDWELVALTSSGVLDLTFGTAGKVRTDMGGDGDAVSSLLTQPDGKIVASGPSAAGSTSFAVARYDTTGALDAGFGTNGTTTVGSHDAGSYRTGLGRLEDGSLMVTTTDLSGRVIVGKLSSNGSLDAGFGTGGTVVTDIAAGATDYGSAMALDANGRTVVAGATITPSGVSRWFVAKYFDTDAPGITISPSNATSCDGSATFQAAATGASPLNYRWQVSTDSGATFDNLTNGANVSGATSGTLNLQNLTGADTGNRYRAVISNGGGTSTTAAAILTIGSAPTITTNPESISVSNGALVEFSADASGTPAPTVLWERSTDGGATFTPMAERIPSKSLAFTASTADDGNQYRARFSNSCGAVATDPATLRVTPVTAHQLVISEFRLEGPGGAGDWYVNLYNGTADPVNLLGWSVRLTRVLGGDLIIEFDTSRVVPPGKSFLLAGTDYSLDSYAVPDYRLDASLDPDSGVRIAGPDFTVTDAAGMVGSTPQLREGAGLTRPTNAGGAQLALTRRYSAGVPVDTDNNAADFTVVATDADTDNHGVGAVLGAPAPRNLASLPNRNDILRSYLFDPSKTAAQAPNRVVAGTTLTVRREIRNQSTTETIHSLRLRITSLTTYGNTTASQAILRMISSSDETVSGKSVKGITLDAPPSAASGGGVGSSLTVPLGAAGLAPGESVNVAIVLRIERTGSFSFGYNAEAN